MADDRYTAICVVLIVEDVSCAGARAPDVGMVSSRLALQRLGFQ
jgi:hypothetical protein